MWSFHEDFLPLVKKVWDSHMNCNALTRVARKLFQLKSALKLWNVSTFGWVDKEIHLVEDQLVSLENEVARNYSERAELKCYSLR